MRLMMLNGGKSLYTVVRRLVPSEIDIVEVDSFTKAADCLREDPPEAAIIDLTAMPLPWCELQDLCGSHEPPIPVLFESCVHDTPRDAGLGELGTSASFLAKPYHLEDLQAEIDRLIGSADAAARPD